MLAIVLFMHLFIPLAIRHIKIMHAHPLQVPLGLALISRSSHLVLTTSTPFEPNPYYYSIANLLRMCKHCSGRGSIPLCMWRLTRFAVRFWRSRTWRICAYQLQLFQRLATSHLCHCQSSINPGEMQPCLNVVISPPGLLLQ